MLKLGDDRFDFVEIEEIAGGEISDGGDESNDAELGEGDEEGIVRSHQG